MGPPVVGTHHDGRVLGAERSSSELVAHVSNCGGAIDLVPLARRIAALGEMSEVASRDDTQCDADQRPSTNTQCYG
jgi:hypothetical protein